MPIPDGARKPDAFAPVQRKRRHLRQATIILPTGKRIKRNVTLGPVAGFDGGDNNDTPHEQSPLLGGKPFKEQPPGYAQLLLDKAKNNASRAWNFSRSKTGRGVFKCSIAYLLGSLATFIPQISNLLGHQDGKHMVATVTVYFHPARSIGSMFEAMVCAVVAFLYAAFISFSSMGVSIFFGGKLENIVLGHVVVLIIFCGGGLGFVGWTKQRLGHPLVNISCSLTCLAIITVLTKEGAVQAAEFSDAKVNQVMFMIIMGVLATTAVSFVIWPVSAKSDLRDDIANVTNSFRDSFTIITRGFLSGSEEDLKQEAFNEATERNRKLYASITKNLKEAKNEHLVFGTERQYELEVKLVNCMQRLSHNIGGLRSAANTQFILINNNLPDETSPGSPVSVDSERQKRSSSPKLPSSIAPHSRSYDLLTSPTGTPGERSVASTPNLLSQGIVSRTDSFSSASNAEDIFSTFIVQLGPSMKSLAITLRKILDELPFTDDGSIAVNAHFKSSLADAIKLYTASRQASLELLYKNKSMNKQRPLAIQADFEEVAASCGYFSFSLLDFANEMQEYLNVLDDLKLEVEERPEGRTWKWLRPWSRLARSRPDSDRSREENLLDQNKLNDVPGGVPSPVTRKATANARSKDSSLVENLRLKLWRTLSFFRRDDIKYAIKVGVGAALYALPSFLASTRPIYQHWRGEWGLLSYMLVCSMTLGSSNTTGLARFLGTCLGAVCAILAWIISRENVFALAFFGWVMSYWTAYITVAMGKGPLGRFIMLTYNLSALYAYSLSMNDADGDEDEGGESPAITEIALHRVVAVFSGCLWGLVITRLIWPISARQKFKDGLSLLWLRMGLIWKRDPLNILLPTATGSSRPSYAYMDLGEEFELHQFLTRLDNLRDSASSEVDLRGPFPNDTYGRVLSSTKNMLDAFHAMNVTIGKNTRASKGEADILRYTADERAQLCARISHLFQVLASSMKLQYPLNEALPSADNARERLLAKLFRFRKEEKEFLCASDEDFELLYAYALVTGQLAKEIQAVGLEMEKLFGTLNEELLTLE